MEADWPLPPERCTFTPVWREAPLDEPAASVKGSHVLIFDGGHPVIVALANALAEGGAIVTVVRPGPHSRPQVRVSTRSGPGTPTISSEPFDALLADPPADIVTGNSRLTEPAGDAVDPAAIAVGVDGGFYSLLRSLGQELAARGTGSAVRMHVVSSNMQEISGAEPLEPAKALLLGPVMLAQREIAGVTCRSIDLAVPGLLPTATVAGQLMPKIRRQRTTPRWAGAAKMAA